MDDDSMIDRALSAYFRRAAFMQQPGRNDCEVRAHDGRYYVILRNGGGTLAVYLVHGNPLAEYRLEGLKEWPATLDEY
jgi:hypothetical protein